MRNISDVIDAVRRRIELRIAECRDVRLPRPIVVIESDDWGSIRMPSVKVLDDLKAKGYRYADYIGYDKYDTLASNDDLEVLLDTLSSVKDSEGNQARLTMNTVVCNPNFERIRQSAYQEYYYASTPSASLSRERSVTLDIFSLTLAKVSRAHSLFSLSISL